MEPLIQQRCFHHAGREAVARCPDCGRFYCRECITEHGDRVICAACLKKTLSRSEHGASRWRALTCTMRAAFSILLLWLVFYTVGRWLLLLPSSFHEGTMWRSILEAGL